MPRGGTRPGEEVRDGKKHDDHGDFGRVGNRGGLCAMALRILGNARKAGRGFRVPAFWVPSRLNFTDTSPIWPYFQDAFLIRRRARSSSLYNAHIRGRAVMFPILPGAALRFTPVLCCAENPAKFWSGYGSERASLVAGLRSTGSDGYPHPRKSGQNGGARRPPRPSVRKIGKTSHAP